MRNRTFFLFAGGRPSRRLAIGALALVVGCSKQREQKPQAVPVTVATVETRDVPNVVSINGAVEPLQTVAVASQVGGILDRVVFTEGQDVSAGQLLFQIDPRPFQAALDQAKAALTRDQAQAQSAQHDAERYQTLVKQDYVTQSQADQASATAASLAATVQADRAAIQQAQLNLAYTTIRAPISGKTGSLLVKQGNLVRANSTPPLVVINQIRPILVHFSVPQSQLPDIQRYSRGHTLNVTVVPAEGTGVASKGTLSFIDNNVDSASGTVLLKAQCSNSNEALWPGQFVNVNLQLYVQRNAVTVPTQAVLTGQQGTYVFTVDGSGAARQRLVVTGHTMDSLVVIQRGLSPGERVIVDGQSRVVPGGKVHITREGGTQTQQQSPQQQQSPA